MRIMPKGTRWREIFKCRTKGCPAILKVTEKDVFIEHFENLAFFQMSYLCPKCKKINYITEISPSILSDGTFVKALPLFHKLPPKYEVWLKKHERAEKRRKAQRNRQRRECCRDYRIRKCKMCS
jgi:hypothetical protein